MNTRSRGLDPEEAAEAKPDPVPKSGGAYSLSPQRLLSRGEMMRRCLGDKDRAVIRKRRAPIQSNRPQVAIQCIRRVQIDIEAIQASAGSRRAPSCFPLMPFHKLVRCAQELLKVPFFMRIPSPGGSAVTEIDAVRVSGDIIEVTAQDGQMGDRGTEECRQSST